MKEFKTETGRINTSKVVDGAINKDVPVKKKTGPAPVDKKELELFKKTRAYRQIKAFSLIKGYSPAQTHTIVRKAMNNLELPISAYPEYLQDVVGLASLFKFKDSKEGQDFWFNITVQVRGVI